MSCLRASQLFQIFVESARAMSANSSSVFVSSLAFPLSVPELDPSVAFRRHCGRFKAEQGPTAPLVTEASANTETTISSVHSVHIAYSLESAVLNRLIFVVDKGLPRPITSNIDVRSGRPNLQEEKDQVVDNGAQAK